MRFKFVAYAVLGILFLPGLLMAGVVKNQTFSKEDIEEMKKTTAVLETRLGNMEIEFYPDKAPNHVNSFIELAKSGFYDGTSFHRVIPGFMIQGGDPNSKDDNRGNDGVGGPGFNLKAEFNDVHHARGILSMARSQHPDSAGSQFFICVADAPHLDRQYTVFGKVISGIEVADKIVTQPRDRRDNPREKVEMKIRIVEPGK